MPTELRQDSPAPEGADAPGARRHPDGERHPHRISVATRAVLHVLGWLMVAVGIVGGFLPVLQGWIFILLGAAILSVASDRVHRWLRRRLERWPRAHETMEAMREKILRRLHRG